MLANQRFHVGRPLDRREAAIEDKLGHTGCRLDFGLEDVRLQRIEKPLREQFRRDLIRHGFCCLDEHLVGDTLCLGRVDCHGDCGKDVEVVRLPGEVCLAVDVHGSEWHARRIDRLAAGPGVGLLGCALSTARGIRERENDRTLVEASHGLDDGLGERSADCADTDDGCRFDTFDRSHKVPGRGVWVRVRQLEIDQVGAAGLKESVNIEHVHAGLGVGERHTLIHERGAEQIR